MNSSEKNSIGLGTAAIGRPLYINLKTPLERQSFDRDLFRLNGTKVLDAAYNMGIRHFDTAPGYGMAEDLIIQWIKEKNDHEISISSKWGYRYVANFDPKATIHEIKDHSLTMLNTQWEQTKQLLPYLNLYQIHSATIDTGVLENTKVLNQLHTLKKQHRIHIGLSVSGDQQWEVMDMAMKVSIDGESLFQSVQFTFNLLEQNLLIKADQINRLKGPIIIKEALANGRIFPNDQYPHYKELYTYLNNLSLKYQVGIDAVALQYCQACFPKAMVLSGANNDVHLASNLKVNSIVLSKIEIDKLQGFGIKSSDYWKERKELQWN